MQSSKAKSIGYWVTTGIAVFVFGPGALPDVLQNPDAVAYIGHLGYPPYFVTLIGVWKMLGALALLVPGFPRLKEWAYAGLFFDLTGAAISHTVKGTGAIDVLLPIGVLGVLIASWALRPESRRLAGPLI
jgi:uncharacterized membrane protein YphA (DoxX/SURF4 family)